MIPASKTHVFLLSSFSKPEEKISLKQKIQRLGGTLLETSFFQTSATHVVCKSPSRGEKYLCACVRGRWLLTPEYVHDSERAGKWLSETTYQWCVQAGNCVLV